MYAGRHTDRRVGRQAGRQGCKQAGRQTSRHADKQAGRQTGRQTSRKAKMQAVIGDRDRGGNGGMPGKHSMGIYRRGSMPPLAVGFESG